MGRLRPLDKALVLILVPLWAACFGLSVKTQIDGGGIAYLGLSVEGAQSYPALTGEFSPFLYSSNPLEKAGLRPGDRLVRVGRADLRGVGILGFVRRAREQAGRDLSVSLVYERGGKRRETSLAMFPVSTVLPWLLPSIAFVASALFLLLRARPTRTVRTYFHGSFCCAFTFCGFAGSEWEICAWCGMFVVTNSLVLPLLFRCAFIFPDDRGLEGRWHRIWPWLFAAPGPFIAIAFAGQITAGETAANAMMALGTVALLAVGTYNYRRGDPIVRRQIKWVLFGLYCTLLPVIGASGIAAFEPRFGWLVLPSYCAAFFIPLSLFISVARFNLFDIDRLISGTASYTILVILLALGGEVLFEPLAARAASSAGLDPGTGQVFFVVLLAAVLVPAQRAWRPYLDRIFFAEGRSLETGIEGILEKLSHAPDPEAVVQQTGAGIESTFCPEFCVIYQRAGEVFAPIYVSGSGEFPAIPAGSQGIRMVETKIAPIRLDPRGRTSTSADRIDSPVSGAVVIVPLRCQGAPNAFVGIGPKRSGDVYTSTDLSLLSAVAHAVSTQLGRGISHEAA